MSKIGLSLVDVAEIKLREAREPMNIYDLYDKICEEKEITDENKDNQISQFYADITTSAKFVYVGENTWDLKDNQKTDLWEKDGSYYKEYNEVVIPEEYLEKPKPKAEPVKEETVTVTPEPVVEEKIEVTPAPAKEETVEVVADEEYISEEFDDELFDDFDEDKYNEYMDTYEDQYED